ncbi:MAG TPA: winged helix-turn-helix domain-containing protein [bacterium]|nr:winged helix-turn-helix domain-containing protein [bacterium]
MSELNKTTQDLIGIFNSTKLLILKELSECTDKICGCDLIEKLAIPKNLLSYHIRTLRENGFIEEARCGQRKTYRIPENKSSKVRQILEIVELIKK